jgi:hypothetical protein
VLFVEPVIAQQMPQGRRSSRGNIVLVMERAGQLLAGVQIRQLQTTRSH